MGSVYKVYSKAHERLNLQNTCIQRSARVTSPLLLDGDLKTAPLNQNTHYG